MNFTQLVFEQNHLNRNALIYNSQSVSYKTILENTKKYYSFLKKEKISHKDNVLIHLPDSPGFICLILSCWAIGAKTCHPNLFVHGNNMNNLINLLDPKIIITNKENSFKFLNVTNKVILFEDIATSYFKQEDLEFHNYDSEEVLWYPLSSGTTGESKCIKQTLTNVIEWTRAWINETKWDRNDIIWVTGKLQFNYSFVLSFLTNFIAGSCSVITKTIPSPTAVEETFNKFKVNHFYTIPSFVDLLVNYPKKINFNQCKVLQVSGDYFPEFLSKKFQQVYQKKIHNVIGCADVFHNYTNNEDTASHRHCGKPIEGVTIQIKNDMGEICKIGEIGEIFVKAKFLGKGYLNDYNSSEVFNDGFVKTNDLGHLDENNNLYFSDRKNNIFKINSLFVSPVEIEDKILQYPGIKDCQITVVKKSKRVSQLVASVVSLSDITVLDLKRYLKNNLESYKIPKKFYFVDKIPKTWNGKKLRILTKN